MPNERPDNMHSIIQEALIAKGLRPETPGDIEAMLDTIGGDDFPADKVERMLRKIRGEEPIGVGSIQEEKERIQALNAEERQLVAFYRAKGQEIPADIQAKLEAMRRRAREEGKADDDE